MNRLDSFLALLCLGVLAVVAYCVSRLRKRREEEWKRRAQAAVEEEFNRLAECEPQIRRRLAAGALRCLVENMNAPATSRTEQKAL